MCNTRLSFRQPQTHTQGELADLLGYTHRQMRRLLRTTPMPPKAVVVVAVEPPKPEPICRRCGRSLNAVNQACGGPHPLRGPHG